MRERKAPGTRPTPTVNFYSVGSATFSFSTVNSDTCVAAAFDTTQRTDQRAAYRRRRVHDRGRFRRHGLAVQGDDQRQDVPLEPRLRGIPFNPGDSVFFNIAGDVAGFPALSGIARTAEPFTIARPVIPPVGQAMTINWTPATDNNAAMYVAAAVQQGRRHESQRANILRLP